MDKEPLSLRFAKNVEENRKKLIQNCLNNGKFVSKEANLDYVVSVNNSITQEGSNAIPSRTITYFDLDGTVLLEEEFFPGDPLPTIDVEPDYDPEYLEFTGWKYSSNVVNTDGILTADDDVMVGARYRVKETIDVEGVAVRPTILKITVNESLGLSPKIGLTRATNAYVDWGDGVVESMSTTGSTITKSHTYSTGGNYVIKLYATSEYSFYTGSGTYLLGSKDYNNCLLQCYCGDFFQHSISYSSYMWNYCESLLALLFSDSMTRLNGYSCQYCKSLKAIVFPDSIDTLSADIFYQCNSLQHVILSNKLSNIPDYAFGQCYTLNKIHLPESVTQINLYAFSACINLSRIKLPALVHTLKNSAFQGCSALQEVIFPENLGYLGDNAFSGCYSLTNVILPNSVSHMGNSCFSGCYSLKTITLPQSLQSLNSSVFNSCYALTDIKIPETVTTIGTSAFQYARTLRELEIPDSVTTIEKSAFQYCESLQEMYIPSNVSFIGSNTFSGCYNLRQVTLPEKLQTLEASVFSVCYGLTTLILPTNFALGLDLSTCHSMPPNAYAHIAKQIADLTNTTPQTLKINKNHRLKLYSVYVDNTTGDVCESTDANAVTVFDYIINKNWTVSST